MKGYDGPLIVDGKRIDGREYDEMRSVKLEVGVLKRADGSAYIEMGDNKILVAVYGPREVHPKHLQEPDRAILTCRYNMAPFSVSERKRPGPDRRSVEISKVIKNALLPTIFIEHFPRTKVDIFIEVLQSDAGTRCAGITAASLALVDAGIPVRDLVAAVSVGKIEDTLVLDLCGIEDNYGSADVPIAMIPPKKEITLIQMDGQLTKEEFKEVFRLANKGISELYELQKEALRKRCEVGD